MRIVLSVIVGLVAILSSLSALSHHSFSAEFDVGRPIEVTGEITSIEWTNPHAWLHIAVIEKQDDGKENKQDWKIELLGVNTLFRAGMTPKSVKVGDVLTVTGFGSRDGTNTANASSVINAETNKTLWASARSKSKK